MRKIMLHFLIFFIVVGCSTQPAPLDQEINLVKNEVVEKSIYLKNRQIYSLEFLFSREAQSFEELRTLIGAGHVCQINEPCPTGVVIPVKWTLKNADTGIIVASNQISSSDSCGWSRENVYRNIGGFSVPEGKYIIRIEILESIPELSKLKTKVKIYRPSK